MKKYLTDLQKKFIDEYIVDLSPERAAIRAGYRKKSALKNAKKLLEDSYILKCIKAAIEEQTRRLRIQKSYIVQKLLKVVEFSLYEEELFDKSGSPTGKMKLRDTTAAMRALEMLCKYCGIGDKSKSDLEQEMSHIGIVKGLDESKL